MNTTIYKYIDARYIYNLVVGKKIYFSNTSKWPDFLDGYLAKLVSHEVSPKVNSYASCWTRHQGVGRLVDKPDWSSRAIQSVIQNGTESMWALYCKNGGVRISTTIQKARDALDAFQEKLGYDVGIYNGDVLYCNENDFPNTMKEKALLHKRPNFYADDEYRASCKTRGAGWQGCLPRSLRPIFAVVGRRSRARLS